MKRVVELLVVSGMLVAGGGAGAQRGESSHLDTVLHQMDVASAKFHSAEADFQWDLYERVVKQTTTQKGSIYFQKQGGATLMGAKILPPSAKVFAYKNGLLRIYDPGTKQITNMSAKGKEAQVESFLTLGFGGKGSDLAKNWTIKDLGTASITEGAKVITAAKLDLVPKEQSVANNFSHITIWVDLDRDISVRQEFYTPSEDSKTATYSNVRYNQKVDTKQFELK